MENYMNKNDYPHLSLFLPIGWNKPSANSSPSTKCKQPTAIFADVPSRVVDLVCVGAK